MKIYPLNQFPVLFNNNHETFQSLGLPCTTPNMEGHTLTEEELKGERKLISLEFNWLPTEVALAYNAAETEKEKYKVLVERVYGNCKLNCKGCYAKQDDLFKGHNLLTPAQILELIKESVEKLGTKTLKYLGPSEFFRDKEVFDHLDAIEKLNVTLNVFVKDPLFGDDAAVEELFGHLGLHTAEQFVEKLSSYKFLRLIYNFRSFDSELTNDLVRGGYKGKADYNEDYKTVQTRSLQLLYKHFTLPELEAHCESRLVIVNTPIVQDTINEALEIFQYFIDRGVPVCSTTSMQSGCGGKLYNELDNDFMGKFSRFYIQANTHAIKRGLITQKYLEKYGPSPYAGTTHCMQLSNGLLIRETGQLMRCPGADNKEWRDDITPEELLNNGIEWAWKKSINFNQKGSINIGCLAKPRVFTPEFIQLVKDKIEF